MITEESSRTSVRRRNRAAVARSILVVCGCSTLLAYATSAPFGAVLIVQSPLLLLLVRRKDPVRQGSWNPTDAV